MLRRWKREQRKDPDDASCSFVGFSQRVCVRNEAAPVGRLPGAVGELSRHQPLVAAQRELGSHQESSVEVGKAAHLQQRRHRRQGGALLLGTQLGLGMQEGRREKKKKKGGGGRFKVWTFFSKMNHTKEKDFTFALIET